MGLEGVPFRASLFRFGFREAKGREHQIGKEKMCVFGETQGSDAKQGSVATLGWYDGTPLG
jgi:hypothetical protein